MPELAIDTAVYSDLESAETKFSVDSVSTDGPSESKETEYTNTGWAKQLGYYKSIPELKASIDALARWTMGKGIKTDPETNSILQGIKGFGKDTFNTIIENQTRVSKIGGDSYAEIIRNDDGMFINLKPLDPGVMKIVVNRKGIIKHYIQISKVKGGDKKFQPEDIYHLSRNRVADEIHGESLIDALKEIIDARHEAMETQRVVMRRYAKPRIVYKLDTDIQSQIDAFKVKADYANAKGENIYIPKDAVEAEVLSVPSNATLNPLPWIQQLNSNFFQATGVPQIIVGGTSEITEAAAKIAYLAFEQTIEEEQLYIEEQCGVQLGIKIELEFPASLENEMLSDRSKSETMQSSTPEDTSVKGVGLNPAGAGA